jgi:dipeptidyl aminopeptidase/acylaminoacyl peptidase
VYTFLPRIKGPVVMLNGKLDTIVHLESSVLPFFAALGTSGERKRLVTPDTGHSVPPNKLRTETLDWLDKYLGPV